MAEMPVTAILNFRSLTYGPVGRSFHCLMHPIFLKTISKVDPVLGDRLHNSQLMAPFSVSPVMGFKRKISPGRPIWVRMCLLNDILEDVFFRVLESGALSTLIQIENHSFQLEDIVLGKSGNRFWSGRESYSEIFHQNDAQKVSIEIKSPMSFKRGDLHYPMLDPKLFFGNLARRWNLFSSLKLTENPECDDVSFSFLELKTVPYALRKGGTILGIVGKATFIFRSSPESLKYYNTLLRYAFYAGVGVKTTQGMGMCRIIE